MKNCRDAILNAPIVNTARLSTTGSIISVKETETFTSRYDEATD